MFLSSRLLCLLALVAAFAVAGCEKTQTLLDDAKQRADKFGAETAEGTAAETDAPTDDLDGALPLAPEVVPTGNPEATLAVVDDATVIAEWNATKTHDRTDSSISRLLRASPAGREEITAVDFTGAGSGLTAAGFRLLKELPLLKSLNCSVHQMSADQVAAIGDLPQLENLTCKASGLNDDMLAPLSKLATLRSLDVANNAPLTDAGLKSIRNLVELQSLDIERTRVTGACFLKANFLGGLKHLNANGSAFADGFAALKSAPNLEYLGVSDTYCTDQHMQFLNGLGKLREIHLHGNGGVTDLGFSFLKGNSNLEVIDIRATNVSGASLKFLLKAKNLRALRTEQSKVDGLTLAALRKAHPNATIQ